MFRVKLTKKCFMNLPDNVLLISNIGYSMTEPCFSEEIAPLNEREEQWQRIIAAGAAQRLFHICKNMGEWTSFLFQVINKKKCLNASRATH
jgi:hypothetical protein